MGNAEQPKGNYKKLVLGLVGLTVLILGAVYVLWGSALFDDIPNSVPEVEDRAVLSKQETQLTPQVDYLQPVKVAAEPKSPPVSTTPAPSAEEKEVKETETEDLGSRIKQILGNLF